MIKYAPYIDGTIPAFDNTKIIVPFRHNPAVAKDKVEGMALCIKNLDGNSVIYYHTEKENIDWNNNTVSFSGVDNYFLKKNEVFIKNGDINEDGVIDIKDLNLMKKYLNGHYNDGDNDIISRILNCDLNEDGVINGKDSGIFERFIFRRSGQYFKVQLAYYESDFQDDTKHYSTLTYSSVGITKYIGEASIDCTYKEGSDIFFPKIEITYSCDDTTELPYSYKVFKGEEALAEGYFNNGATKKTIGLSKALNRFKSQGLSVEVITINKFKAIGNITFDKALDNIASTTSPIGFDYEYGEAIIADNINVSYRLESKEITKNSFPEEKLIKLNKGKNDNTLEHGKNYVYAYLNYNNVNNQQYLVCYPSITPYFEDMFLQDATHTLRIKFNPKVSSFKTNIPEAKQETLGGRYPYFFRNGDAYYNEFPISGLVSYHMQDNEKFMNDTQLGLVENSGKRSNTNSTGAIEDKVRTTNLTDYNVAAERKFKLAVLEWLNNGKPKLFRSPTEGNYVVRIMNVSLSPEERLGRMLHTFNATAVECAAADYPSLVANELVPGGSNQ